MSRLLRSKQVKKNSDRKVLRKLFTKMYEQAGAAAGAGAAGGPTPEAGPAPEGFQGDDVVDGDYKEV